MIVQFWLLLTTIFSFVYLSICSVLIQPFYNNFSVFYWNEYLSVYIMVLVCVNTYTGCWNLSKLLVFVLTTLGYLTSSCSPNLTMVAWQRCNIFVRGQSLIKPEICLYKISILKQGNEVSAPNVRECYFTKYSNNISFKQDLSCQLAWNHTSRQSISSEFKIMAYDKWGEFLAW